MRTPRRRHAHRSRSVPRARLPVAATAALLLVAGPRAGAADRVLVDTISLDDTPSYAVSTADGAFVVIGTISSDTVEVIDGRTFEPVEGGLSLARATAAASSIAASGTASERIALGTDDGYLELFDVEAISDWADGDEDAPASEDLRVDATGNDPVSALAFDVTGSRLYAGNATDEVVDVLDAASGTVLGDGIALGRAPVCAVGAVTGITERIFFGSDDGNLAWMNALTYAPATLVVDAGQTGDLVDVAAATFPTASPRVLVVDRDHSSLAVVDPSVPSVVDDVTLGGSPVAVEVSGSDASTVIWVAVASPDQVEAYDENLDVAQDPIALPAAPVSMAEAGGYLFVGLEDGRVAVITDRPWVEIAGTDPEALNDAGTDVVVRVTSSESGTAVVKVDGSQVATQSVTAGVEAEIAVDGSVLEDRLEEGTNRVRVEVTDGAGLTGHDEVLLTLDVPPGVPRHLTVGFGDGRVIARWDSPKNGGATGYSVHFGTGSSGTNGVGTLTSPQETEGHEYVVDVENGTRVYMKVAAIDSAGNLSAYVGPRSAIAQETLGAAELAGDDGGFVCATTLGRRSARAAAVLPPAALALLALIAIRVAHRRRGA